MAWNNAKINLQRAVRRMSIDEDIVVENFPTPQQRVGGRTVESLSVTAAVTASVQPARGDTLQLLPEAQRTGDEIEVWCLQELRPLNRSSAKSPSLIHWKGKKYKVAVLEDWWQHGRYWFALCSKVDQ